MGRSLESMFCICSTRFTLEPSVPSSVTRSQASEGYIYTTRILCCLAPRWNWPVGSPAKTERSKEGRGHSIHYPTSSPLSLFFSTKGFSLRHTYSSLPVLAKPPGACLPLPSKAQELAQGTTHLLQVPFNPALNFAKSSLGKSLQLPCLSVLHTHTISGSWLAPEAWNKL